MITPNRSEFRQVVGRWRDAGEMTAKALALRISLGVAAVLITRSEEGMSLYTADGALDIPGRRAGGPMTSPGAGDTVIAALGALLGAGADLPSAVRIANEAGRRRRRQAGNRGRHARRVALISGARVGQAESRVMAKPKTIYSCTECGGQAPKWQGQCPHCSAWNTLVETIAATPATRFQTVAGKASTVRALGTVDARKTSRFPTGLEEFDRVLGGGLVPGGVILLGGDPGIGKSTLLLQAMAAIGAAKKALYVTGEESVEQVALRAQRLGLLNAPVSLLAEVQLEAIIATIGEESPEVVVIDSIQTAYTEALASAPGSVAQVRECAAQLTRLAKQRHIVVISSAT